MSGPARLGASPGGPRAASGPDSEVGSESRTTLRLPGMQMDLMGDVAGTRMLQWGRDLDRLGVVAGDGGGRVGRVGSSPADSDDPTRNRARCHPLSSLTISGLPRLPLPGRAKAAMHYMYCTERACYILPIALPFAVQAASGACGCARWQTGRLRVMGQLGGRAGGVWPPLKRGPSRSEETDSACLHVRHIARSFHAGACVRVPESVCKCVCARVRV